MTASQGSSVPHVIQDVTLARVVTDRTQLRRLAPYMGHESTVSQAAGTLGLHVTAAYKQAQRFLNLGLLHETRQKQRSGRAIRYYRAPVAFFVPFHVLGLEEIGVHNRQQHLYRFERNFAHVMRQEPLHHWGALTQVMPSGEPFLEFMNLEGALLNPTADDAPLILSGWNLLRLTPTEARTLQRQLLAVLQPYFNRSDQHGDLYLSGVFLCRDTPE